MIEGLNKRSNDTHCRVTASLLTQLLSPCYFNKCHSRLEDMDGIGNITKAGKEYLENTSLLHLWLHFLHLCINTKAADFLLPPAFSTTDHTSKETNK